MEYLVKLKIEMVDLEDEDYKETLKWGSERDLTYYDSVYTVLSKKMDGTLLTADGFLYDKARKIHQGNTSKDYGKLSN